jgi:hypothetical protein
METVGCMKRAANLFPNELSGKKKLLFIRFVLIA